MQGSTATASRPSTSSSDVVRHRKLSNRIA
jgi:hypothetical protein